MKDCSDKTQRISENDWADLVAKYNLGVHYDTLRKSSQFITGGSFVSEYYKWKESQRKTDDKEDDYLSKLRIEKQDIQKEKQKLSDERTSLNKLLREQSRREELFNIVKRVIDEYEPIIYDYVPSPIIDSDSDMVIHLSDVHSGVDIDSAFNVFNTQVLIDRLHRYYIEIEEIQNLHGAENAHLILGGDLIQGIIHVNSRIESKEHIVEQIKLVSDIIGKFIDSFKSKFSNVYVYTVPGNHGRSTASKEESVKGENFDLLVPYILSKDFKNTDNVHIMDNLIDDCIANFNVRGHSVFAVHGDKDSPNAVVYNMTKMARKAKVPLPDIIYMGHRHTNGLSTIDDVKVVQSGCCDGMDTFAIDGRFVGTPEQTVTIVTEKNRIKALYDIQLA